MVDTRDPLEADERIAAIEWPGYVDSWQAGDTE
jgi:hypothetical protein